MAAFFSPNAFNERLPDGTGHDGAGHPRLRIAVSGTTGSRSFDALVDTGFTGFLLVPEASAGSLGLIPLSTTWHPLADGERVPTRLVAWLSERDRKYVEGS